MRAGIILANRGELCGPFGFSLTPTARHSEARVLQHRLLLSRSLRTPPERFVTQRQVHGAGIGYIGGPGRLALPAAPQRWRSIRHRFARESDILISRRRGFSLLLSVADCCPLLILAPVQGAVAAVHSGWRGCVAGAPAAAVAALGERYGAAPASLRAWVGPCAGFDAPTYEVGQEVYDALPHQRGCFSAAGRPGHYFLDLGRVVTQQLLAAGVTPRRITAVALDTISDRRFHSHRREAGDSGRMAAWITLE